jgi:hypothetical protein
MCVTLVSWKSIIYCSLYAVKMSCVCKVLNFKHVSLCMVFWSLESLLYMVCGFCDSQKLNVFNVWFLCLSKV